MGKYIFLAFVVIIVAGPTIILRIWSRYSHWEKIKEMVSKPFVCSNCGHRFYTKQRIIRIVGENKAILKCPNCKKRDVCGRPYDFDAEEK